MNKSLIEEILDEMAEMYKLNETEVLVAKVAMQNLAFYMLYGK